MRLGLMLWVVLTTASLAPAQEEAAIKQAYVTYLQARMDRDLEAAKAASTGDELGQRNLAVDVERQILTNKMQAARAKFQNTGAPASQPTPQKAADTSKAMLDAANVTIEGDTAKLTPMGATNSYGFRKVNGAWKADLNHWERPVDTERLQMMEKANPLLRDILSKIDSGEIKTAQDLQAAMMALERSVRPATRPSTQPAR